MEKSLLQKARELKPKTRAAIEEEFGCALQDGDEISIVAYPLYPPLDAPDDATRQAAAARLRSMFEKFDQQNTATPEETEEIVLEALRHRKPGYREHE